MVQMANFMLRVQLTLKLRSKEGPRATSSLPAATLGGWFVAPNKGAFLPELTEVHPEYVPRLAMLGHGRHPRKVLRTVPAHLGD